MRWGTNNDTRALEMCEAAGWLSYDNWNNATIWAKAALKMDRSNEFSMLLE